MRQFGYNLKGIDYCLPGYALSLLFIREINMGRVELLAMKHLDNGMAICLKPKKSFVMTKTLVDDIRVIQKKIVEKYYSEPWDGIYYLVWYLYAGNIPWKGLDFAYIYKTLLKNREKEVDQYIGDIYEILFLNYIGLGLPVLSCSIANREVSGVSKEFFLLNRVSFIKNIKSPSEESHMKKIDLHLENTKMHFSPEIYKRNHCYKMDFVDVASIGKVLNEINFKPLSGCEIEKIKLHFDEMKEQTLFKIQHLATKNLNIFNRLSGIQSCEHRKWGSVAK